eukprot:TRINITY_DN2007_c4_g1_i1.p1 TRINITY_DN2007_c4_g1~~TRINITY_DN2007_c4_g1_i1.p1  ORF type:complete len:176 (-),score=22.69 TRINITY_DN2007_c4_g1_i1:44-550(-)
MGGVWQDLDCCGKCLAFTTCLFSFFFVFLAVPYIIAIFTEGLSALIAMYIVSILITIVIAVCGCYGSITTNEKCIGSYSFIQGCMFVITLLQIILAYITYQNCNESGEVGFLGDYNPFSFFCTSAGDTNFWIPLLAGLYINVISLFASCGLSHKLKQGASGYADNYHG